MLDMEMGYRYEESQKAQVNIRLLERVQDVVVMDRIQYMVNILYEKRVSAALLEKHQSQLYILMYVSQSP